MSRYRLVEFLAGTYYEAISDVPGMVKLFVPSYGYMLVPGSLLVEAPPPPLPPEPELRAVVLDGEGWAWQRTENGWMPGGGAPRAWAEVCQFGAPTRLVPDPFAEPVTLPWVDAEHDIRVDLTTGRFDDEPADEFPAVCLHLDNPSELPPDAARAFGLAVVAAADAAEAQR